MRSALCLFLLACGGSQSTAPTPTKPDPITDGTPDKTPKPDLLPPAPTKPVTTKSLAAIGLDPTALDRKADPCEDFYQFACGGWMAKTQIAADKSVEMRSFVAIEDRNLDFLHSTFDKLVATPDKDPAHQKIATFYASCMDQATIDKAGVAPIAGLRATIDKVKDVKSLSTAVAQLHAAGTGVLFNVGSTQDAGNATSVIIGIADGGLGLPDRDFYLKDDEQMKQVRAAYEQYVASLLTEIGRKPDVAKTEAAAILALETEIAKVSMDKVDARDPKKTYNKIDKAGVAKAMPSFDWATFWNATGFGKVDGVDVQSPAFLQGVDKLLSSTKPETWRAYLTFHVASATAPLLSQKIEKTQFDFMSKLTGQPEMEPRWKRCVNATSGAVPDLVGQLFVAERFGGDSKAAAESYVHAISDAMDANLKQLPWMDDKTKTEAFRKRTAMTYQIGFPSKWKTYEFKVDKKTYATNMLAAMRDATVKDAAKAGKPVDRESWDWPAMIVNASYNPTKNMMRFPAGILQPPFYSVDAAVPVNLGAMGMVVGHELTHGFDDQGSKFDADGNLKNWWQAETEKKFNERTQCVKDQYSKYEVAGGAKVNGPLTAGENIADIGGIKLAFTAYRKLRAPSPDTVVADGFTEDQQFFLAFGQAWCAKFRPELEKLLVNTDVHSPARWRVNGALADTPDFARAFSCKAGAKLAPAKACVVW